MKIISEYQGIDQYCDRMAHIYDDKGLKVEYYIQGNPVNLVDVSKHSLRYAEDLAENWVTGIIND